MTASYPYGGIAIFSDFFGISFSLVHATNKGAAWGLFENFSDLLLIFRILSIVALFIYLLFFKPTLTRRISLALVAAGATGNVIDHFVYGHVVDMFYFTFWGYSYPVFNVADSAIFSGVAFMVLHSFFKKKSYATI